MSTIIELRCLDQVLTVESTPVIASGGVDVDLIQVEFCDKWDGLTKSAVFWRSEKDAYHVPLDENDSCVIPPEVLGDEGVLYFGLFGVSSAGKQRTSEVMRYTIVKGAITSGTKPSDPTPDIYSQLLQQYTELRAAVNTTAGAAAAAQTTADDAVAAAGAAQTTADEAKTAAGAAQTAADKALLEKAETVTYTATVTTTWTADGNYFYQDIDVPGILATDEPIPATDPGSDNAANLLYDAAFGKVFRITISADSVRVWATEAISTAFPIRLKVVR